MTEAPKVFTIHIILRGDSTYQARVEELKGCFAYGATIGEVFERLQKAIQLAIMTQEPDDAT